MNIPGACAQHAVISDTCRTNHGDMPAFEEAVRRLRVEYDRIVAGWTIGKGAQIHLAITVERPVAVTEHICKGCRRKFLKAGGTLLGLCEDCAAADEYAMSSH